MDVAFISLFLIFSTNAESISVLFSNHKEFPRVLFYLYISSRSENRVAFCTLQVRGVYYTQPVHVKTSDLRKSFNCLV